MTALYGKALFCLPPRVCKKVCDTYLRIMIVPSLLGEGEGKKAKSGLLSCVYNKSITIVTTVMSQTQYHRPNSVSEWGRAA